jgi:signal transduction histidine kinase
MKEISAQTFFQAIVIEACDFDSRKISAFDIQLVNYLHLRWSRGELDDQVEQFVHHNCGAPRRSLSRSHSGKLELAVLAGAPLLCNCGNFCVAAGFIPIHHATSMRQWKGANMMKADAPRGRGELAAARGKTAKATRTGESMIRPAEALKHHSDRLELVGRIATGLCHDLSNLMMPLRICMSSLKVSPMPQEAHDRLNLASMCADEMAGLVSHVRRMVNSDRQTYQEEDLDLEQWWPQTHRLLRALVPDLITIQADFQPLVIRVVEAELMRVVLNLVMNAAEAIVDAGKKRGTIRVWARLNAEGTAVEMGVEDDGPGIPPELTEKIFEPCFSTKSGRESLGMGLSIVKDFVERAGGSIVVQSKPGVGTSFILRLPAASLHESSTAIGSTLT